MRGPTVSDQVTGLYAANAILSALVERGRTGIGRRVDVAMIDASIAFIADAFACNIEAGIEWDPEYRAAMSHAFVLRCDPGQLLAVHRGGPGPQWLLFPDALYPSQLAKDA